MSGSCKKDGKYLLRIFVMSLLKLNRAYVVELGGQKMIEEYHRDSQGVIR